jgi:hypothetical protein
MLTIIQLLKNACLGKILYRNLSESHDGLKALFLDSRINPWRDSIPYKESREDQVWAIISLLYGRRSNDDEGDALVLFLRILGEFISPGDPLHKEILVLAQELEGLVCPVQASETPPLGERIAMDWEQKAKVVTALLACPSIADGETRNTIVKQWKQDFSGAAVKRSPANDRADLMEIVTSCLNQEGGLQTFIGMVRFQEGDNIPRRDLDELLEEMGFSF